MARLMAAASGDNTSSSTWRLIDSTSFLESETSSTILTTSYTGSSSFTPGAITIDGIAVRINFRYGTTGTVSVELYNSTGSASVAGTEVTINMTNIPDASGTELNGGWVFFKFASSVTLSAGVAYTVRAKTSTASMLGLHTSTGTNFCRILRTTTNQAPAAGDDRFITGEWTGPNTVNSIVVTHDNTTLVDYGAGSNNLVLPALSISNNGTYKASTAASQTLLFKVSGNVVVYSGGKLEFGDPAGTKIPASSSIDVLLDVATNVEFGFDIRGGGTFVAASDVNRLRNTYLTAVAAASATVVTLNSTSNWVNGDTLLFAASNASTSSAETKTTTTIDSSTQVTLSAGLTTSKNGTAPIQAFVSNTTSNVKIHGNGTTTAAYVRFRARSIGNFEHVEFYFLGSGTSLKDGVTLEHASTVTTVTFSKCVFRNFHSSGKMVTNSFGFSVTDCVFYNVSNFNISGTNSTDSSVLIANCNIYSATINLNALGLYPTINYINSTGSSSVNVVGGGIDRTFNNFSFQSAFGFGVSTSTSGTVTVNNLIAYQSTMMNISNYTASLILNNVIGVGASGASFSSGGTNSLKYLEVNNGTFGNYTSGAQTSCCQLTIFEVAKFKNCTFGVASGSISAHTSSTFTTANAPTNTVPTIYITFDNCILADTVEYSTPGFLSTYAPNSFLAHQRVDGVAVTHKTMFPAGVATTDTTIYRTTSPSLRMTPNASGINLKTSTFKVAVNSGQVCTPSVYIRESESGDGAAYNGARANLYVQQNYALGITNDMLIDTATAASDGAWEMLTGNTIAVTDAGVLEFYVTCDGTTGWINIDDFTATAS